MIRLLAGFINAIQREIQDNLPSLLDSALRMLLQLLSHWKTAISAGPGDKVSDLQLYTQDETLILFNPIQTRGWGVDLLRFA